MGCLGIRLGPLTFYAEDDNAVATVDTFCTGINHHMLHGRSEGNEFIYLEFRARSKAVQKHSRLKEDCHHFLYFPSLKFCFYLFLFFP